jgi:Flp pilus assembly protein TadG
MIRLQFSQSPKPAQSGRHRRRGERGVSTIALVLVLVFFGILPLALLGFEMARASLVQIELQNITDAAALGGTAVLAGGSGANASNSQQNAIQGALEFFVMNSVMNTPLYAATGAAPLLPASFVGGTSNITLYVPTSGSSTPSYVNGPSNTWPGGNLPVHQVWFVTSLYDNAGNLQPLGSNTVQTIQIQTYYTEAPIFVGTFLPIATGFTVSALSFGGLPMLDLVLCFDISGSMDDATPVALVERVWNAPNSTVNWTTCVNTGVTSCPDVANPMGTYAGPCGGDPTTCTDNISNLLGFPGSNVSNGTQTNAGQPQLLAGMDWKFYNVSPAPSREYTFSDDTHSPIPVIPLRILPASQGTAALATAAIVPESGCVPGNTNPVSNGSALTNTSPPSPTLAPGAQVQFTDMVCLLGNVTTGTGTFNFLNNFAVCTEASRGNMESLPMELSALNLPQTTPAIPTGGTYDVNYANVKTALGANSGGGWYQAYWYGVRSNQFPMIVAVQSAVTFLQTMNNSSNAHFGFVSFAGNVPTATGAFWDGTTELGSAVGNRNVDYIYNNAGANASKDTTNTLAGFPLPWVALSSSTPNYTNIESALTGNTVSGSESSLVPNALPVVATGGTDMYDSMQQALTMLTGPAHRTQAKPAAILFTDGIPNFPTGQVAPDYGTFNLALTSFKPANVPVFTIGLYQNTTVQTSQLSILGDNVHYSSLQGIAYYSGNGATFNQVSASSGVSGLNAAFQAIAKSLVVLQQNK